MKQKSLQELRDVAEVRSVLDYEMSKQERLMRWADLLEENSHQSLRSLYETEYASLRNRAAMREDHSPLTVAFEDPLLRAQGLQSDSYGDAIKFFGLSDGDLHYVVCYCLYGHTMTPKTVALRVRALARKASRRAIWQRMMAAVRGTR